MGVDDIFTWNDQREAGSIIMPVCECKKVDFTFEICGQGFCDISLISINLNTVEALSYYFKSKYFKPSLYNQLKSSFYLTWNPKSYIKNIKYLAQ